MKHSKFIAIVLSVVLVFSSCNMNNTTKGGLIGGGGGAALGALVGSLIGGGIGGGTAIGAAIGGAVGTGAGVLIGKKMDKVKQQAEAVQNAQVQTITDANGLEAVKVTFDSGILFTTGSATLSSTAKFSLNQFANNVLKANPDLEVAILGFTDNAGWKNSTAEQSAQKNLNLSQQRADAVKNYLFSQGVLTKQVKTSTGLGEQNPVADNSTDAGKAQNRRVEVYLYASQAMIEAAKKEAQN
ncbi:MAG: OmpA family protein [Prevotellaceae bacterium]|nr:OmpA family protein [Candidatus Colivivens equi]